LPGERLTQVELNRATLARQFLLERVKLDPVTATERIGGLQAQEPASPYIALWSRLAGFEAASLDRAIHDRRLVKAGLLRGTLHLVSARDYLQLHPAVQVTLRGLAVRDQYRNAEVRDIDSLMDVALAFAVEPRDNAEMHDHLAESAAAEGRNVTDVWWRIRREGAFIRTPSKVPWSYSRRPTYAAARAWLGDRPFADEQAALEHVVRRYLGAFGPATIGDLRAWSHVSTSRLRPVIETIPDIIQLRDNGGRTLLDLDDAPRPPAETPAPPRFLPMWDSVLLAHDDRSRILGPGGHLGLFSSNAVMKGSVLVDGFVRAIWIPVKSESTRTLAITPFGEPIPKRERPAITEEGMRLLAFLAPGEKHRVHFGLAD